ncbi:MAG TPA: nickel-binding protein [Gaiellaceae bacterium]
MLRALYLAECYWPDISEEHLERASRRAREAAKALTENGTAVRLRSSWLVPDDEVAFLLFEAVSADAVRQVVERAGVPFERIVQTTELTPECTR